MNITLYLSNKIVNFKLPMIVSGSFSFDADDNEESKLINIEANDNDWILYQTQDVTSIQSSGYTSRIKLTPNTFYILLFCLLRIYFTACSYFKNKCFNLMLQLIKY